MGMDKIFNCPECDGRIEVADPRNMDTVACHSCGREYRLHYIAVDQSWNLEPIEPAEEGEPRRKGEDEPFRNIDEPGGLRKDDLAG